MFNEIYIMRIKEQLRKSLRLILALQSRAVLKKHKPTIIVISGETIPSLTREVIYEAIKERYNPRRNFERSESEFSVPLAILGIPYYPNSLASWAYLLLKVFLQALYLKPYKHILIIQMREIDLKIYNFWIEVLKPNLIIDTDKLNKIEKEEIENGQLPIRVQKQLEQIGLNDLFENSSTNITKVPRINLIPAKNNSLIIDARHFYYPPSLESVIELAESLEGKKYVYTTINKDLAELPLNYAAPKGQTGTIPPKSIIIFRGSKNHFTREIDELKL